MVVSDCHCSILGDHNIGGTGRFRPTWDDAQIPHANKIHDGDLKAVEMIKSKLYLKSIWVCGARK